jgi:hypothetical protein
VRQKVAIVQAPVCSDIGAKLSGRIDVIEAEFFNADSSDVDSNVERN